MDTLNKIQNLLEQTHLTWSRARVLHIRVDCAAVRFSGERVGYIVIISWEKIKISLHGKCKATNKKVVLHWKEQRLET